MLMRRRASIKGIGASIFYDSEVPDFRLVPKVEEAEDAPEIEPIPAPTLRATPGELSTPELIAPYDTGDLVALLETGGQVSAPGDQWAEPPPLFVRGANLATEEGKALAVEEIEASLRARATCPGEASARRTDGWACLLWH